MKHDIKIGDRVGYSAAFLKSTGMHTGDEPFMRGEVLGFEPVSNDYTFAVVKWDGHGVRLANCANLARVGSAAWVGM